MKKKIFTYLFALMSLGLFAQKTIVNPAYEIKASGLTTISKIEYSDTETKVFLHYSFLPHWWTMFDKDQFLEDCDTGKKYMIREVVNTPFDKKIWMPESGEDDFVLIYEPLDTEVRKINYGKNVLGISLTKQHKEKKETKLPKKVKKWFKQELSKVKKEPLKDYNSPDFFNNSPAKLIGYIKGYDPRLEFETGITYMGNSITREDYPIVIEIHEDGRFEAEIPLQHPIYEYLSMNKALINYYLEPGQTLAMVLDWEEFLLADRFRKGRYNFENIEFYGPLAEVNQELLSYSQPIFDYKEFQKQQKEITPKAYKKLKNKSYKSSNIELLKFLVSHNISKKTTQILQNKHELDHATTLFNFVSNRDYYAKKDTLNKILQEPIPNDYYSFLKEINLNKQSLFVNNRFSEFINRFEYCKPFKGHIIYSKPQFKKTFLEYVKSKNIQIDPEFKELLTQYEQITDKEEKIKFHKKNNDRFKNFHTQYSKEYKQYYKSEKVYNRTDIIRWEKKDSILKNHLKLKNNLVYETAKTRSLNASFNNLEKENATKFWSALKENITNPFLVQEGNRMFNKVFPSSENSNLVTKLPKGTATDIFNKIIAPHKGKILFIDFWATSCAPCVGGIKRMKETRAKYAENKDFDFVFITDERGSPKKTYDKFVKEQELKNIYRLPQDDYNYLRQLFKFNGIPRYVVIDKNGDVIDDNFRMYQFDYLLNDILEKHK